MFLSSLNRLACLSLLSIVLVTAAPPNPTVTIESGVVVGRATPVANSSAVVNQFLGLPFAVSPPVRFSPPENPALWSAPLQATAFKPACIQQFKYPAAARAFSQKIFNDPAPAESEDCLYLNVFSLAGNTGGKAVMFWIYGGNLQFGNAGQPVYDGSSFAANQDVVVVTSNYRTNVFGFSNSPEIPFGQQNSGYLDQRKALEWVQQNIHAFGGDPTKVTIFGESAGGYSVKQILANPPSPLPYRAAIMQSEASALVGNGLFNWQALVTAVGCAISVSQLECVRAVPALRLKDFIETKMLDFAPVNDHVTQMNDVRPAVIDHQFAQVPVLMGTTSQEGRVFAAGLLAGTPSISTADFLAATFPGQIALQAAILAAYPRLAAAPYKFLSAVITDVGFTCSTSALSNLLAASGSPTSRYYFNATFPNTQFFPNAGVYHSSEIAEVFGTYPSAKQSTQQVNLSRYMQTAWANFAKDPSAGPGWPALRSNAGVELGDLGGNGIDGEVTIPLLEVDTICPLYNPVYAITGL